MNEMENAGRLFVESEKINRLMTVSCVKRLHRRNVKAAEIMEEMHRVVLLLNLFAL